MPAIDRISIHGFKSIAAVDGLTLGPVTVLIGANGSGKSNFLAIFSLLRAVREDRVREYVAKAGGAARILHLGPKVTEIVRIRIEFGNQGFQYDVSFSPDDADRLLPGPEEFRGVDPGNRSFGGDWPLTEEMLVVTAGREIAAGVLRRLDSWRSYHFHDTGAGAAIKLTAHINDNRYLRTDGANLPAFLYLLRELHPAAYTAIRNAVQLVAPFFDDFVLEPQRLNPEMIRLEWRHRYTDAYFDVSSLSDGTLRFIALATTLLQPLLLRPAVILIDEPELGLHPYAVTLLASLIKVAAVETQIILATQSPQLLDHFRPEDVVIADLIDGGTRLGRLDPDRLAEWLEEYSLGQLWEKNELGGRPGGA